MKPLSYFFVSIIIYTYTKCQTLCEHFLIGMDCSLQILEKASLTGLVNVNKDTSGIKTLLAQQKMIFSCEQSRV